MYRRSLGKWVRLTVKLLVRGVSSRYSRLLLTQPAVRYSSRPLEARDPHTALELQSGFFGFSCITIHSTGTQHIRKSPLLVNDI